VNIQGEGQNRKLTAVGIDLAGNPTATVTIELNEDGKPHPVTGSVVYDAQAWTRPDAYHVNGSRTKAGKVVQTEIIAVSPDGKR